MNRVGVTHALDLRNEERDRIAGDLLDLEAHTSFKLLNDTRLQGETARRWFGVKAAVAELWRLFDAYRTTVDHAAEVLEQHPKPKMDELATLVTLLAGQSVRLPAEPRPVEERSLYPLEDELLTLDEVVDRMDVAFREATATIRDVDAVWGRLLARLAEAETDLLAIAELTTKLRETPELAAEPTAELRDKVDLSAPGQALDPDTARLARDLSCLRASVLSDPLGVGSPSGSANKATGMTATGMAGAGTGVSGAGTDTGMNVSRTGWAELCSAGSAETELDRIRAELTLRRGDLERVLAFRENYDTHRQSLLERIERLRGAENETREAHARVRMKIARPVPPVPRSTTDGFVDGLAMLDSPGVDWPERAGRMARLERGVEEAVKQAQATTAALIGLLGRRDELRGRLDAYRAKAVRLGRAEDPAATRCYQRARDLLWSSSCELHEAAAAVMDYRHAIRGGEG